jgi:AcrR family transcriptional regulator
VAAQTNPKVGRAVAADRGASILEAGNDDPHRVDNSTLTKIVRGAIAALGRHGSQLSMSDVALAANVSRATLYRYFPTKTDVLAAVSEYISSIFVRGAERIAREIKIPIERLKALMSLQIDLATRELITRSNEVEPGLVSKFLADHYSTHLAAVRRVLDPLFDQLDEVSGLALDRDVLAAMVLRMHLSVVIVPPEERWRSSPGVIADMLSALVHSAAPAGKSPRRRLSGRRGSR